MRKNSKKEREIERSELKKIKKEIERESKERSRICRKKWVNRKIKKEKMGNDKSYNDINIYYKN